METDFGSLADLTSPRKRKKRKERKKKKERKEERKKERKRGKMLPFSTSSSSSFDLSSLSLPLSPSLLETKQNEIPAPASNRGSSTGSGIIDSSWLRSLSALRASSAGVLVFLAAVVFGGVGGIASSAFPASSLPSAAPSSELPLPLLPSPSSGVARGGRDCLAAACRGCGSPRDDDKRVGTLLVAADADGIRAAVSGAARALCGSRDRAGRLPTRKRDP